MTCPTFYHVANAITVQGWATDSVPCNNLQPCQPLTTVELPETEMVLPLGSNAVCFASIGQFISSVRSTLSVPFHCLSCRVWVVLSRMHLPFIFTVAYLTSLKTTVTACSSLHSVLHWSCFVQFYMDVTEVKLTLCPGIFHFRASLPLGVNIFDSILMKFIFCHHHAFKKN